MFYNYILSWSLINVFDTYLSKMCFQKMFLKPSEKLAVDHVFNTLKNEVFRDQKSESSIYCGIYNVCSKESTRYYLVIYTHSEGNLQ